MQYGKTLAAGGLVVTLLMAVISLLIGGGGPVFETVWLVALLAMFAGVVMMMMNKATNTAKYVYNEAVPKTIGNFKRSANMKASRAELDKELDDFLKQNGGIWKLKITTRDIILYTQNGKEIDFNAPAKGYESISESYANHVAGKYGCEIEKSYDSDYIGGGEQRVWVGTDIHGNVIGGTETGGGGGYRYYSYSMLYSKEYKKQEEAERRQYLIDGPIGKRV